MSKRVFAFVLLFSLTITLGSSVSKNSAWDQMIRQDPAAADDPTISWRERLILYVLTPEQAEAWYRGVDEESLVLDSGETLSEYLRRQLSPLGTVYVPLPTSCSLFTVDSGQSTGLWARGEDLSWQGGSQKGCGIPQEAVAVVMQYQVETLSGRGGRIKFWSMDQPEPVEGMMPAFMGTTSTMAVVNLCQTGDCEEGEFQLRCTEDAVVQGQVTGYFRPMAVSDQAVIGLPGEGVSHYWEHSSNNFFGTDAGASTIGNYNSFFGGSAGQSNIEGFENSFFGRSAGQSNTTGYNNAFFGYAAGFKNTTSFHNAFFGSYAGGRNTTGSDNSFFGYAAGFNNTTGYNNAFFGEEAGYSNTEGYENSYFGKSAGYYNTTGKWSAFFGNLAGYSNTTGNWNSFFGSTTGFKNTTGYNNAFFGTEAGWSNTTGYDNSLVGFAAGYLNTTGYRNSFFGRSAGAANTVEVGNTFIGYQANLNPGSDPVTSPVENATALGNRSYVSQSNSLVLGSIAGENDATNNVSVGIGTSAPLAPFHVKREDGTSKILVQEVHGTAKARALFELVNNGGPRFQMTDTDSGRRWEFTSLARFNINFLGRAGQEFQVDTQGNGYFAGNVTANGVVYTSDREQKTDFTSVNQSEILDKVASLPVTTWRFKDDEQEVHHMGPMAQDFYAAFGLGADDKHINASDISGVALAAIQGLNEKLEEKDRDIEDIKTLLAGKDAEIEQLKARLARVDALEARLVQMSRQLASLSAISEPLAD